MLEVINSVQLHILVSLPNIDDSHFDKMATILQENEFYFAAAAVRGRYRGGPGGLDPPFRATYRGVLGVWTPILGQHF